MAIKKLFSITRTRARSGKGITVTGTLAELIENNGYTLECGASYQNEKGNWKINRNPKTITSLIANLNRSESNRAANGCASAYYNMASAEDLL